MDKSEAQAGIDQISAARRTAGDLRTYRDSGSIVCAWGVVWLAGFGAQQLLPDAAWMVWVSGWIGALGWTFTRPRKPYDAKAFATWLIVLAFIALLMMIVGADQRMAAMIFGLVLAATYAALGIWAGKRFLVLAVIVLAAACIGWWLLPQFLFFCLAFGGGGALIVGGAWLLRP